MNTNPEDAALRMHCLELAIRQGHGEPVQAAQSFYDFATGQTGVGRVSLRAALDYERAQQRPATPGPCERSAQNEPATPFPLEGSDIETSESYPPRSRPEAMAPQSSTAETPSQTQSPEGGSQDRPWSALIFGDGKIWRHDGSGTIELQMGVSL